MSCEWKPVNCQDYDCEEHLWMGLTKRELNRLQYGMDSIVCGLDPYKVEEIGKKNGVSDRYALVLRHVAAALGHRPTIDRMKHVARESHLHAVRHGLASSLFMYGHYVPGEDR
jgi:hypothetical protein